MENIDRQNDELRKVKIIAQDILDEVVRICNENGLKYYLAYGTLLGAVRHKGFIPWDDDIDIWMLRDDYERFADIASVALKKGYVYQNRNTVKNYPYSYSKVRMAGTLSYDPSFCHLNMEQGIFIDIFPLDNYPNDIDKSYKICKKCIFLNKMIVTTSLNPNKKRNLIKGLMIRFAQLIIPRKLIEFVLKKETTKYNDKKICKIGLHTDEFHYFSFEDFDEGIKLQFENKFYCVPKNYDKILTQIYGNYMELPPVEERKWHFTQVDFGNYFFDKHDC